MIRPVLTLDAALTVGDAVAALEGYADGVDVVVRTPGTRDHLLLHDAQRRGARPDRRARRHRRSSATPLGYTRPGRSPPSNCPSDLAGEAGVVLDGTEVVGLAVPGPGEGPTRGGLFPEPPPAGGETGDGGDDDDLSPIPPSMLPTRSPLAKSFDLAIGAFRALRPIPAGPERFD